MNLYSYRESVKVSGRNYAFTNCPKLTDVYYSGAEAQWKAIEIGKYNDSLTNATIHYNSTMAKKTGKRRRDII